MKNQPTLDRFMEKVDKNGPNGCWNFTSSIHKTGCGSFYYQGKSRSAYRIGYELMVGPLTRDQILHHKCENRQCVNPDHLQVTTHREHLVELSPTQIAYKSKRRTHCPKGHPLEEPNLAKWELPRRLCLACARRACRENMRKKRSGAEGRAKFNAAAREWQTKWRNANREEYRAKARAWYAKKQLRLKLNIVQPAPNTQGLQKP